MPSHPPPRAGGPLVTGTPTAEVAAQLDDLVAAVAELLHVECVGLLLRDQDHRLRTVCSSGPAALGLERAQEITGVGPGPDVHRSGSAVAVTDVLAVPGYADLAPHLDHLRVRAVLSVPVLVRDDVVGNLNAVEPVPHAWSEDQQAGLQTFAALVSDVLALSAAGRREDVAHLAGLLADRDGAAS